MQRSAPYSVWRRMVVAEAAQVESDLGEARRAGPPRPEVAGGDFGAYLGEADTEVATARLAAENEWPHGPIRRLRKVMSELVSVWTGSEHETSTAALHRAEGLLIMVASDNRVRVEALKMEAIFKEASDIPPSDPRHAAYSALFARLKGTSPVDLADRILLREIRREQNEAWEIARSRVRIFRNILSATIPFVSAILIVAAVVGWTDPGLIPLRVKPDHPGAYDVAVVEFLGALGGLLSAVATLRAARNFQRFYGLPLAQSILKIPAGAASGFAGVLLLQDGLLGSIKPLTWEAAIPYALLFGVAQIAVTRQIDTRAGNLLGEANAKSPSTAQSSPALPAGGHDG